jgi:EmrB/QacA subfamily drug resistance transporter
MAELSEKAGKTWVLALTSVASFMVALDALVVTTALSTIRLDLGASIEALEWTVNAYNLSFAVLLLTGAALGDRFGRRRMFAAGLTLFVVASAACAVASNIGTLIAARAVQGAGAALVMPLAMALLSAVFPREERAKALGIFSAVTGLALIAGPVAGGAIADGLAWQWIFWINLPVGAIAIPLIVRRIRESVGSGTGLDVLGLVLVTAAAMGVMWGLMRANSVGWMSLEVVSAITAGIVLGVAFVLWELRVREPMVPMRLFRSRALASGIAASFLFYAAMYGTLFFLPQFLQVAQGHGPFGVGLRLLPWTATLFVFAPIGGGLVNRMGERSLVVAGLGLQAIGMAWIALTATPGLAYTKSHRATRPCRSWGVDGDAGRAERGPGRGRAERDRQGLRHLQHVALSRWRVRGGCAGRGIRRDRKFRLATGVHRRLCSRDRHRCNVVADGRDRGHVVAWAARNGVGAKVARTRCHVAV